VGILGLGRIGQAIADKLAPWNPTIVYHTRSKKDVPYTYYDNLVEMAAACDTIICITPGGPATNRIVNADGSGTHETRAAMGQLTVDNAIQHLGDGTVQTPVPECADM